MPARRVRSKGNLRAGRPGNDEWREGAMLQIRDAMTRDVLTVTSETTLREVAELFVNRHVSGVPVVDGQSVVGVVSATDVLEFIATNPPVPRQKADQGEVGEWSELPKSEPGDAAPG